MLLVFVLADTSHLGAIRRLYDFPYGDKAGHLALYGMLTLLVSLVLLQMRPSRHRLPLIALAGSAVAALVVAEEMSQFWMPSRSVDVFDVMASYAGVIVGGSVALRLVVLRRSLRRG